jgi:hypothetical protein
MLAATQVEERAKQGKLASKKPSTSSSATPPPPEPVSTSGPPSAESAAESASAATDQQPADQESPSPSSSVLDPDISANLQLAWAKYFSMRLVRSHDCFIEGRKQEVEKEDQMFASKESFPRSLA